eukprot:6249311-Pyramimonas_sp.AAC.1
MTGADLDIALSTAADLDIASRDVSWRGCCCLDRLQPTWVLLSRTHSHGCGSRSWNQRPRAGPSMAGGSMGPKKKQV